MPYECCGRERARGQDQPDLVEQQKLTPILRSAIAPPISEAEISGTSSTAPNSPTSKGECVSM